MVDSGGPAARFLGNLSFAALGIGYGRDLLGTDPSQCSRQRTPDERQFPLGSRSGRGMIGEEAADPVEESSQQRADLVGLVEGAIELEADLRRITQARPLADARAEPRRGATHCGHQALLVLATQGHDEGRGVAQVGRRRHQRHHRSARRLER